MLRQTDVIHRSLDRIESLNRGHAEGADMADDTDEEGPAVELGDGEPVEGAPLARIAARLTWAIQKSEIDRKEGDTLLRTPDGPRELSGVLEEVDEAYFDTRRAFEDAVREVIGTGPVPTADADEE